MTIGHVAKRGIERAFFSIFGAKSGSGERRRADFENGGFLEREMQLLSRFPGFRIVGSRRAKK